MEAGDLGNSLTTSLLHLFQMVTPSPPTQPLANPPIT